MGVRGGTSGADRVCARRRRWRSVKVRAGRRGRAEPGRGGAEGAGRARRGVLGAGTGWRTGEGDPGFPGLGKREQAGAGLGFAGTGEGA